MVIVKITLSKITPLNFRLWTCLPPLCLRHPCREHPVYHLKSDRREDVILPFFPLPRKYLRSFESKNPTIRPPKITSNLSPILTLLEGFYLYLFIVGFKSDLFSHLVVFLWTGCIGSSFWGKSGEKW